MSSPGERQGREGPATSGATDGVAAPKLQRIEIADETLPEGYRRELEASSDRGAIGALFELFSAPRRLFASLTIESGWLAPLILVLSFGLLQCLVQVSGSEFDAWYDLQDKKARQLMPDWQRRASDGAPAKDRAVRARLSRFAHKAQIFAAPPARAALGLLGGGLLLVTISTLCGGRRNFSLALTVSAHALLIEAPRSLAVGIVAAATGLPRPLTNLSGLAGPGTAPTTATLLSWVDPFALGFFALLGLGLLDTLKVQRRARAAMLLLLFVCALCLAQVAASAGLGSLPLNFNVSFERG